jgi:hypothetical protein
MTVSSLSFREQTAKTGEVRRRRFRKSGAVLDQRENSNTGEVNAVSERPRKPHENTSNLNAQVRLAEAEGIEPTQRLAAPHRF